jgi:hypothetical protein
MTHDSGDEDLQRRFAALREHDARSIPGFDALVRRAAARPLRRGRRAALVAAGITVLVVAGAVGTLLLRRPAFALATWRSPTEFLLHGPGEEILRAVPSVSASVVRLEVGAAAGHFE